jgi:iron complex outermembrane receptor protein
MNVVSLSIPSRALMAALLLAGLASIADAQTQSATTAPAAAANQPTGSLEEIIVTAQKRSERLQDVPVTITALSSDYLEKNGVERMSDLPTAVSGLLWSNQGAWIEPNIRGVYTNVAAIGSGSPIAIYLDGIYQPSQSGTIFNLPDVRDVEVLKGPQGTLFGRNATGGAIVINTRDPSFTPTGDINVSAGAYAGSSVQTAGHYNVNGFLSGPLDKISDDLAGSISASYDATNGFTTDDVDGSRQGKIQSSVVRGKMLWKPSDSLQVLGTAYYSQMEDQVGEEAVPQNGVTAASHYPGSILPSSQPWHFTFEGAVPGSWGNIKGASLKATMEFSAGTLTSLTGFNQSSVYVSVPIGAAYAPACAAAFVCINGVVIPRDEAVSQEFDFASRKWGGFSYIAGIFGLYDNQREHDSYNGGEFSDDSTIVTHAAAIFGEATYEFTDQFSAIAGVRLSRDSLNAKGRDGGPFGGYPPPGPPAGPFVQYGDRSWDSATPRASLQYKFTPNLNAYFTYSQGFKAGVVSGQLPHPTPGDPYPQPADPEKISAYEVGMKAATDTYSANLAAFYYDYKDLQVEVFNTTTFSTIPENATTAEIYGLDFDGTAQLNDWFKLRLSGTWLPTAKYKEFEQATAYVPPLTPSGELTTDNNYNASNSRMLVTPKFTGTIAGTFGQNFEWGRFEATSSLYYSTGYRWEYTDTVTTGPYALLGANLTFSPNVNRFKYTLYGKNITNRAYVQGALPTAAANIIYWNLAREVGVTVGYSF